MCWCKKTGQMSLQCSAARMCCYCSECGEIDVPYHKRVCKGLNKLIKPRIKDSPILREWLNFPPYKK